MRRTRRHPCRTRRAVRRVLAGWLTRLRRILHRAGVVALGCGVALCQTGQAEPVDARNAVRLTTGLEAPECPLGTDEAPGVALPDASIERLDFEAAPLAQVFKAFAEYAGINIVLADNVRGVVTLHLRKVGWRDAFEALLDAHGLAARRHGSIFWVMPADQLAGRERARVDSQLHAASTERLDTDVYELHYLRADAARQLIAGPGNARLLSRRGAASADARTNQLFVSDMASNLIRIRSVIERADRPTRQVLIEARIVEAEDGFGRHLGARMSLLGAGTSVADAAHAAANGGRATVFAPGTPGGAPLAPGRPGAAHLRDREASSPGSGHGVAGGDAVRSTGTGVAGSVADAGAGAGAASGSGSLQPGDATMGTTLGATLPDAIAGAVGTLYSLPAGAIAGFGAAGAGLALLSVGAQRVLALELSALEADGRGRIVSSPRVVTADRIKAVIEQGTELPYQTKVGEKESGVQFRRAELKLEVTPQITPSGQVMLDLDITKDTVGALTQSGPAINTKHVRTQVQVENGGTVAIGGIYIQDERNDVAAVPGLGALPVIGALFRRHATSRTKSELIVFITPNVVAGPPDGASTGLPYAEPTLRPDGAHSTKPADSSLIPPT